MKFSLSIFSAVAAAVAAMWRAFAAGAPSSSQNDGDGFDVSPISVHLVQRYAYAGATNTEIADYFLADEVIVAEEYHDVLRSSRAMRKIAIRTYQTEAAKKLNASMLTWLGKNELGQSANPEGPGEALPAENEMV